MGKRRVQLGLKYGQQVTYKNVLGEIRVGVVLKENKVTVRLQDRFRQLSISKKLVEV